MFSLELTECYRAGMLLHKKQDKISVTDNPKTLWESEPVFMKQKLDNFWTKFYSLKAEEDQNDDNVSFTCF